MAETTLNAHRPGTTTQGVMLLTLGQFALVAFGYAVHVLGSRRLSQADYGRFVVVLSAATWVRVGIGSLIVPGISKIVSENHARLRAALRAAAGWHWAMAGACSVALLAFTPLIASAMGDPALAPLLIVAALELPFFAAFTLAQSLLTAVRHYVAASVTLTVYSVVRAAGACALILLMGKAVGATIGLAAGSILGGAIGLWLLLGLRSRWPSEPYPPMVRRSLSWAAMTLPSSMCVMMLLTLDMWLVKPLVGGAAAGIYGAAFAVSRLPDILNQGLTAAVFAKVSSALAEGKIAVARSVAVGAMRFVLVVFVPVCALTACSSGAIIRMLFTDKYTEAAPLLTILVAAICFGAGFKLTLQLLAAADRPGPRLAFVMALLPLSLALNVILIRHYGLIGAARASMITMAAGVAVGVVFVYRFLGVWPPLWTALRCGSAAAVAYGVGLHWMPGGALVIVKLALLGLLYLGLLAMLGEIGAADLRAVRRSVFRGEEAGVYAESTALSTRADN
jgi:O-antigen/teichoic acid export membrane protein